MAKMVTSLHSVVSVIIGGGGGVRGYAGTPKFPAVEAHTEHRVLVQRSGGPIVPPPPDPGDLAGKYGDRSPLSES